MKNYIERIAVCGNNNRREAIIKILESLNVNYKIVGTTTKNIVVSFNESNNRIVIGAHYDAATEVCPGANDNASSCVVLLNLIESFKNTLLSIDFVFFDKEEQLFIGSKEYIEIIGSSNIKAMINLDMCGLGNNIVIQHKDYILDDFNDSLFKLIKSNVNNIIKICPGGDSVSFEEVGIPTLFIFNSTDNDLELFKKYDKSYGMDMSILNADFLVTMHKVTDTIDMFDESGMILIYNHLNNKLKEFEEMVKEEYLKNDDNHYVYLNLK